MYYVCIKLHEARLFVTFDSSVDGNAVMKSQNQGVQEPTTMQCAPKTPELSQSCGSLHAVSTEFNRS